MLQRMFRCLQCFGGVGPDVLSRGYPVCLQDQLPECAGVLVVVGQQGQQLSPQFWVAAEPVKQRGRKDLRIQQPSGGTV
ncbi:hypothetical protein D3C76_1694570 [compost metagenome]